MAWLVKHNLCLRCFKCLLCAKDHPPEVEIVGSESRFTQRLVFLNSMEERDTGIQRMRDVMLDHGLGQPSISVVDNEVIVTLKGSGDNLDRIRIPDKYKSGFSLRMNQN